MQQVLFKLKNQSLWLNTARSIYWEQGAALIVADLHFGKTGHFRKAGIAVPQSVFKEDVQQLFALIQFYKPQQLIVVGDMFHSHENKELDWFAKWRKDMHALSIHLIKGNHDILLQSYYEQCNLTTHEEKLPLHPFCFKHEPPTVDECTNDFYYFSGHIHPGIVLNGNAKQALRFPCFYFSKSFAILPAFSKFTGVKKMELQKGDTIFYIAGNQIFNFQ